MTTTKENILAAADLIERDGWTQGSDGRWGCKRCVVTALQDVIPDKDWSDYDSDFYVQYRESKRIIAEALHVPTGDIIHWNDAEGRTADEVIGKLREIGNAL